MITIMIIIKQKIYKKSYVIVFDYIHSGPEIQDSYIKKKLHSLI